MNSKSINSQNNVATIITLTFLASAFICIFIGSINIYQAILTSLVFFLWLFFTIKAPNISNSQKLTLGIIWTLVLCISYLIYFTLIRLERSDSLIIYGSYGDEFDYINIIKSGNLSVVFNSIDVSALYWFYIAFLNLFSLNGEYIELVYVLNIFLFIAGNYFLYLVIKKYYGNNFAWSAYLLLAAVPEGYFWALSLYKESLVYFFMCLSLYLYSSRNYLAFVVGIGFSSLFRPGMVFVAFGEYLAQQKTSLIRRLLTGLIISIVFIFSLYYLTSYFELLLRPGRLEVIFNSLNFLGLESNSPFLIFYGIAFIMFPILLMYQPTPFFLLSNTKDPFLIGWSDLSFSALLIFPVISLYVFYCVINFVKRFKGDIFFRLSYIYFFLLSVSFIFLTLRHRFTVYAFLISGAVIWLNQQLRRQKNMSLIFATSAYSAAFIVGLLLNAIKNT